MRRSILSTYLIATALYLNAQSSDEQPQESLGQKIDDLTYSWDLESDNINSYEGLSKFCLDEEYRFEVIGLLNDIHHYDSVLYQRLLKANRASHGNKEIEKAIDDIKKFETDYSMKKFIHFLHDECNARNDICF